MEANPQPPRRGQRIFRGLLTTAFFVAVLAGVNWWQTRPLASGEAPPLSGRLISGQPFDLGALRGRPVLVHFWADWCPICRAEHGSIASLAQDAAIVSVAMQSGDDDTVRAYLRAEGLSFPTIADPTRSIAARWGVRAVPTSFVIDSSGRIAFSTVGFSTEAGLRARLWAADGL